MFPMCPMGFLKSLTSIHVFLELRISNRINLLVLGEGGTDYKSALSTVQVGSPEEIITNCPDQFSLH